jgi:acyl-CoA thioester hydrolase
MGPGGGPTTIDIRWRDLDPYGHVNQAVYLTFAEEVLDDWYRRRFGLGAGEVWDYVAAKSTIEYRSELRQTDRQVVGTVRLLRVGTKSVTTSVELRSRDGRLAATVEMVSVAIDGRGGPPRAVTEAERAALEA